ncbi:MAG TPA: hypothetical protein VNE41_01375 [Chitinophagaceae bacterium]|nr:hypothetical protein [Chitinophagaceae bacterium]
MSQSFKKIVSLVILVVFFFSTTPPDFLHKLFANHQDTIDSIHQDARFSPRHIHCVFLHIVLSHYMADTTAPVISEQLFFQNLLINIPDSYHEIFQDGPSLRAPPVRS